MLFYRKEDVISAIAMHLMNDDMRSEDLAAKYGIEGSDDLGDWIEAAERVMDDVRIIQI